MDIYEAIYGRRSVRKFDTGREVGRDVIEKLLSAAVMAPSAGNLQPWRFIVVQEEYLKKQLSEAASRQGFVADAPVNIIVCADLYIAGKGYGQRGTELYCIQDTAASVENLMLAAHAEGLGTCWVGAFDEYSVVNILELPDNLRPVAIITIGYPAKLPRERRRIDISEVSEWR